MNATPALASVTSLVLLVLAMAGCGDPAPIAAGEPAALALSAPTATDAPPPFAADLDLAALIRTTALARYPDFEARKAASVSEVDDMILAKAGFDTLPTIGEEADPALKALYIDVATLFQSNEVIAAQALLRTEPALSPAGQELQIIVDEAYTPVGDPENLEGAEHPDAFAAELAEYAGRAEKAMASLRQSRLNGQQRELAELRVLGGVYENQVATHAADAALKRLGDDARTRRAIEKALADAMH